MDKKLLSISSGINLDNFVYFAYSKKDHFKLFKGLTKDEISDKQDINLKRYQDLLIINFILENIPKGSKILEIGGGKSRVIEALKKYYEFWNLDKFEGVGLGPKKINQDGFKVIKDYIGNYNKELPDNYFDFVFSISVLEHIPKNYNSYFNILNDIDRVLKKGGYSVQCIDAVYKDRLYNSNNIIYFLITNQKVLYKYTSIYFLNKEINTNMLFHVSKETYDKKWLANTKKDYHEFGRPFSVNVFWKK